MMMPENKGIRVSIAKAGCQRYTEDRRTKGVNRLRIREDTDCATVLWKNRATVNRMAAPTAKIGHLIASPVILFWYTANDRAMVRMRKARSIKALLSH